MLICPPSPIMHKQSFSTREISNCLPLITQEAFFLLLLVTSQKDDESRVDPLSSLSSLLFPVWIVFCDLVNPNGFEKVRLHSGFVSAAEDDDVNGPSDGTPVRVPIYAWAVTSGEILIH